MRGSLSLCLAVRGGPRREGNSGAGVVPELHACTVIPSLTHMSPDPALTLNYNYILLSMSVSVCVFTCCVHACTGSVVCVPFYRMHASVHNDQVVLPE